MRHITRMFVLAALAASAVSCGDVVRDSKSPMLLVIDSLQGAPGASPGTFTAFLVSDVQNMVTSGGTCTLAAPCPTSFNDVGQAAIRIVPKNITNPTAPSTNNAVTINRYHVSYTRADGRNTQGVDVPYAFDGVVTATISAAGTVGFELVRTVAKREPPLAQLISNPQVITVFAQVTFYGRDVVGNDVSVTGNIQIDFGDFAQ